MAKTTKKIYIFSILKLFQLFSQNAPEHIDPSCHFKFLNNFYEEVANLYKFQYQKKIGNFSTKFKGKLYFICKNTASSACRAQNLRKTPSWLHPYLHT